MTAKRHEEHNPDRSAERDAERAERLREAYARGRLTGWVLAELLIRRERTT